MTESLRAETALAPDQVEWLHLLVGDWQLVSDLSFADLVLWVADRSNGWFAAAHVRPTTGPMVFFDDLVGRRLRSGLRPLVEQSRRTRAIAKEPGPEWREDRPVREEAIPVVHRGQVLAVVTRHTNLAQMRTPSRLELTYLATADALARMIASGDFPAGGAPTGQRRGAPRAGDGVIRLDAEARVTYASPNATSAIHRLGHAGDVTGASLPAITTTLVRPGAPVDEGLGLVVTGRAPWRTEIESRGACVSLRAIPLIEQGQRVGALLLLRDVSELRRRELELLTKDATIREIHHRVKNNLQTVAALLRLQARRLPEAPARQALEEAVRRVATIALVHDTLSQGADESVDFDEIADRLLTAVVEVATTWEVEVRTARTGSFGRLLADDATTLAMSVSELVQNAVEHGLAADGGTVTLDAMRSRLDGEDLLTITIEDDGRGLPPELAPASMGRLDRPHPGGLGTQIVTSLVQDMRGTITWQRRSPRGTTVQLVARLRRSTDF
jgi:two-component sensor histidine kinase